MSQPQGKVEETRSSAIARHQQQCSICKSRWRQQIEQDWLDWRSPTKMALDYGLSRDGIYRHIRAFHLDGKRRKNILRVLEHFIERAELTPVSGAEIVSAVKLYEKLAAQAPQDEQDQGVNSKTLFERMSPDERKAFARDGSLPAWFPGEKEAATGESQEGSKSGEPPDDTTVQ